MVNWRYCCTDALTISNKFKLRSSEDRSWITSTFRPIRPQLKTSAVRITTRFYFFLYPGSYRQASLYTDSTYLVVWFFFNVSCPDLNLSSIQTKGSSFFFHSISRFQQPFFFLSAFVKTKHWPNKKKTENELHKRAGRPKQKKNIFYFLDPQNVHLFLHAEFTKTRSI